MPSRAHRSGAARVAASSSFTQQARQDAPHFDESGRVRQRLEEDGRIDPVGELLNRDRQRRLDRIAVAHRLEQGCDFAPSPCLAVKVAIVGHVR
jgi:hypothetical protein